MNCRNVCRVAFGVFALIAVTAKPIPAQQQSFHPDVEQLVQTVTQRLEAVGDRLGLNDEQRQKIRDIAASYREKYQTLRNERRALLQEEQQAVNPILTEQQRTQARQFIEDRRQEREAAPADDEQPRYSDVTDTLADRLQAAAHKLNLTDEQREKIRTAVAPFAERHQQQRQQRRELVEDEFQEIAEVLTPQQRREAQQAVMQHAVLAQAAQMLCDRLETAATRLGLTDEQRTKIRDAAKSARTKFQQARCERRQLMQQELDAAREVLTEDQREQVRNYFQDRVVVIGIDPEALRYPEVQQMLRETVGERLEAADDELQLTDEQQQKIRDIAKDFVAKYQQQRQEREQIRREELQAISSILTPEQRQQVQNFVSERTERTERSRNR